MSSGRTSECATPAATSWQSCSFGAGEFPCTHPCLEGFVEAPAWSFHVSCATSEVVVSRDSRRYIATVALAPKSLAELLVEPPVPPWWCSRGSFDQQSGVEEPFGHLAARSDGCRYTARVARMPLTRPPCLLTLNWTVILFGTGR